MFLEKKNFEIKYNTQKWVRAPAKVQVPCPVFHLSSVFLLRYENSHAECYVTIRRHISSSYRLGDYLSPPQFIRDAIRDRHLHLLEALRYEDKELS